MSYRRSPSWSSGYSSYTTTTRVSIHWSNKSAAYAIKFADTKNWNEMQILLGYLKNIPYGERDYDPDNKIWFLVEKHIEAFKEMVKNLSMYFEMDFVAKPTGQTNMAIFIPVDVYLDKFKNLTGQSIKDLDYPSAKKIYRRWIMKNHPDVGGDSMIASEVNTCWSNLELTYFKSKKEPEYVQETSA